METTIPAGSMTPCLSKLPAENPQADVDDVMLPN